MKKFPAVIILLLMLMITAAPADVRAESSASFVFSDNGITGSSSYYDSFINGTVLTVRADGVYEISGECSGGSIVVNGGLSDVELIFKDLSLKSTDTAPVVIKKNTEAVIHTEGTVDLTDDEDPANETSSDKTTADAFEGAAVKLKKGAEVTFCGGGILNIHGNAKNGINGGAGTSVVFADSSGKYNINAAGNAVSADGSITVYGGTFEIDAGKDGIKAVPDGDDSVSEGRIGIYGGFFDIDTDGDGIQADSELVIYNGSFDIKTFTGYYTDGTKYWNRNNYKAKGYKGSFDQDSMSSKGLKASGDRVDITNCINIYGGSFVMDTSDDAVHSDGEAAVYGGTFLIDTGDDAFHAEHSIIIGSDEGYERDPEITVNHCFEGMESSHVYFYNGRYLCEDAVTDGINASGSASPAATSDDSIEIYGGNIYINSGGDGFDSNGSLILKGGSAVIYSMRGNSEDSPLDSNGEMLIDGITLFGAGSDGVDGFIDSGCFSQNYCQKQLMADKGKVVCIRSGEYVIFNGILPKRADYILYTAPGLEDSDVVVEEAFEADMCKSSDKDHAYGKLEITEPPDEDTDGIGKYVCDKCGKTCFKTLHFDKEYSCEGHEGAPPAEDCGFDVFFEYDEGVDSVDVYYTQDNDSPVIKGSTRAVSRDSKTGFPSSDGNGQVNFRIKLKSGYSLDNVAASEGSYKNLKSDPEDNGDTGLWRMTKVKADSVVEIATVLKPAITSDENIYILPGRTYKIDAVTGNEPATSGNTLFKSSRNSCAEVSPEGMITAIRQGTADITLIPKAGGEAAVCSVRVLFTDVPVSHSYFKAVSWAADSGIAGGYTDGSGAYGVKDPVTRGQVVAFLWRMAGKPEPAGKSQTFKDVKVTHPFYKAVQWAYESKITAGYGNGKFGVRDHCTRGQIVTFLWRYYGRPAAEAKHPIFSDVSQKHSFFKAVQWAGENGITTGYKNGSFGVNDSCTRGQMAMFLWRCVRSN